MAVVGLAPMQRRRAPAALPDQTRKRAAKRFQGSASCFERLLVGGQDFRRPCQVFPDPGGNRRGSEMARAFITHRSDEGPATPRPCEALR
jgi:hypothetical protein